MTAKKPEKDGKAPPQAGVRLPPRPRAEPAVSQAQDDAMLAAAAKIASARIARDRQHFAALRADASKLIRAYGGVDSKKDPTLAKEALQYYERFVRRVLAAPDAGRNR